MLVLPTHCPPPLTNHKSFPLPDSLKTPWGGGEVVVHHWRPTRCGRADHERSSCGCCPGCRKMWWWLINVMMGMWGNIEGIIRVLLLRVGVHYWARIHKTTVRGVWVHVIIVVVVVIA